MLSLPAECFAFDFDTFLFLKEYNFPITDCFKVLDLRKVKLDISLNQLDHIKETIKRIKQKAPNLTNVNLYFHYWYIRFENGKLKELQHQLTEKLKTIDVMVGFFNNDTHIDFEVCIYEKYIEDGTEIGGTINIKNYKTNSNFKTH